MTKIYEDLDLKALREELNIDFAHFTYKKDQCSCCYGPKDLPSLYWKDKVIPEGDDYSYILFKNAHNGRGSVTKYDTIGHVNIQWGNLSEEQLDGVCRILQEQLGYGYKVTKPKTSLYCIEINKL